MMSGKGDEENEPEGSLSSWWGSFYDSAKQKLVETNEFLVRDIKEFTDTVKNDTSKIVANTAASMKEQLNIKVNLDEASNATKVVTNSITGFLGKVVQHVAPIPPDDQDGESTMYLGTSSGVKVMTPAEARLFTLQTSPATYCNEPDHAAEFDSWRGSFRLEEKKEELSLLMLDSKEVRSLYTKLVPEAVSHVEFWTRYFYKKQLLEKAEERRAKLMERAQAGGGVELGWDDEDDYDVIEASNIESSPRIDVKPSASLPCDDVIAEESGDIKNTENNRLNEASRESDHVNESATESFAVICGTDPDEIVKEVDDRIPADTVIASSPPSGSVNHTTTSSPKSIGKGAESSSGADSSEWEKEFDIDMTEDEIKQALQEESNEDDLEDWEEWE